jgi:hypothetical protein
METAYKSVAAASPEESQLAKRLYKWVWASHF